MDSNTVACVSGYFDPVHVGHIEYFKMAKRASGARHLVVIVNNDEQARLKKGQSFMPLEERMKIISEFRCVDQVVASIDVDRTVCRTLESMGAYVDFFCNGGDQRNYNIPEAVICSKLKIGLIDKLGDKIQSSSWLLTKNKKTFWQSIWDLVKDFLHSGGHLA